MSRPIEPTPKLNIKDTINFLNKLYKNQNIKEIINLKKSVEETRKQEIKENCTISE